MKKLLFALLAVASPLIASPPGPRCLIPEFRVSYFYFTESVLRDIFPDATMNYHFSLMHPLCHGFYAWGNVSYLHQEGLSLEGENKTTITLAPVTLGLKYFTPVCYNWTKAYIGVGGRYTYLTNQNHSPFVKRGVYRSGLGATATGGLIFRFNRGFTLDLFTDVSVCKMHFGHPHPGVTNESTHFGGWDFGAGFTYFY